MLGSTPNVAGAVHSGQPQLHAGRANSMEPPAERPMYRRRERRVRRRYAADFRACTHLIKAK
eukprot:157849-Chlamydomonas_euryale.AAC.8